MTNHRVLVETMNQVSPGVPAYDPISSPNVFSVKFNSLKLEAMQLTAIALY